MKVYHIIVVILCFYSIIHFILSLYDIFTSSSSIDTSTTVVKEADGNNYNNWIDKKKWYSHKYIFIGGLHSIDNSLMEKLLSSQLYASGFKISSTDVKSRAACTVLDMMNKKRCKGLYDEGKFSFIIELYDTILYYAILYYAMLC